MPDLEHVKHAVTDVPVEPIILSRWSPRAFADKTVSDADLKTVFTAATWAASSRNEQPWRFLVGRKGDSTWQRIFDSLVPGNQSWAASAPVLFAAFASQKFQQNGSPNKTAGHDTGAACATLALQATALGLHLHGMGGFEAETLRAYFAVPSDFEPTACWALGYLGDLENLPENYRAQEQEPRERKGIDEVVFAEHWAQPIQL